MFVRLGFSSGLFASSVASSVSSSVIFSRSLLFFWSLPFLSSFLFCRLVFSLFFHFLGLLSVASVVACLVASSVAFSVVSSVSFFVCSFSSFSFFVLSSRLATPVSFSFSVFLFFFLFFCNLVFSFVLFFCVLLGSVFVFVFCSSHPFSSFFFLLVLLSLRRMGCRVLRLRLWGEFGRCVFLGWFLCSSGARDSLLLLSFGFSGY